MTDLAAVIVADTSTVINLNATGCASAIVAALPNSVVVVDAVVAELAQGQSQGRRDRDQLERLVAAGLVQIVELDDTGLRYFEELVVGTAAETLDDGEAATIAYAVTEGAIALIDERKANRLCARRFASLRLGCTLDVLSHDAVFGRLGGDRLAEAVFNALHDGRMRVFRQHVEWVLRLIGNERAMLCTSLPASVRQQIRATNQNR